MKLEKLKYISTIWNGDCPANILKNQISQKYFAKLINDVCNITPTKLVAWHLKKVVAWQHKEWTVTN
jgi:hypothetical protein